MIARRIPEFVLLYIIVPVAFSLALIWIRLQILPLLVLLAAFCVTLLLRDPEFERRRLGWARYRLKPMLMLALLVAALILITMVLFRPGHLFQFPQQRPVLWAMVMILYPVLSAYPQEIIYRVFFMHRYQCLFPDSRLRILASAVIFGAHHAVMGNVAAVVLSTLAGWRFAHTYERSRSALVTAFEHAIYGWIIFTIGMGDLFYLGTTRFLDR